MLIVITGNPGVGKHTISKSLADSIGYEILDINQLVIDSGIGQKKSKTLDVDVSKLKKILKSKIEKNQIVVGHLAPYVLTKNQVNKAIILRQSPYKLESVYKKRKYSKQKIAENLESEILGIIAFDSISNFGSVKSYQVNTTSKSVSQITKKIIKILDGKDDGDIVDWLSLIVKKNDLKKFFSY